MKKKAKLAKLVLNEKEIKLLAYILGDFEDRYLEGDRKSKRESETLMTLMEIVAKSMDDGKIPM